ncbi:RNA-guided endonuclease InsQ/TnpB family protein [Aerosakkonema funiforme]|uniref:RNA-guided endonuclease InsQ/TnpB family protein n=1 Tax=Aerosakkonema funiforme TaxID=1246630 RepID=UPI0035B88E52
MISSQVYKLRPSSSQSATMDAWLDMLKSHYNWCLADRIESYQQQFIQGAYCHLRTKAEASPLTCCVVKNGAPGNPWQERGKKRNAGTIQDAALTELKKARPWFKNIESTVLQSNIDRLNTAYQNFFEGRGFPKFKNRSNFRSFEYKPGRVKIDGSKVYLPRIGWMRFYNSRPIPEGFVIKTVTIRRKTDGWYMSVRIEDKSIPEIVKRDISDLKTVVGIDLGLTKLVHCSDGSQINHPRFATNNKTKRTLKIRQRRVSRTKKSGKNRRKQNAKVASLHNQITNRRNAYLWQTANKIVNKADAIAVEVLNIKGMVKRCKPKQCQETGRFVSNGQSAKRGLNRSILDASWGDLISKIEYLAAKLGKIVLKVDSKHTSVTCSACGCVDRASRDREKFICVECGYFAHADLQAALNIKNRAIKQYGLIIRKIKKVREDFAEPRQLTLFETPTLESTRGYRRQQTAINGKRSVPGNLAVQMDLFSGGYIGLNPVESPVLPVGGVSSPLRKIGMRVTLSSLGQPLRLLCAYNKFFFNKFMPLFS